MKCSFLFIGILLLFACGEQTPPEIEIDETPSTEAAEESEAQHSFDPGYNLLTSGATWYATSDTLGSIVDTGDALLSEDGATVHFTMTEKTGEEWPYVELIATTEADFIERETVQIAYQCDAPLILKLAQSDFSYEGDATYAHYEYVLPPSGEITTATVAIADFEQPDWAPEESLETPLLLENVSALYLVPQLNPEVGGESSLSVEYLRIK
ncbi:hypothetical protein [Chitinivibrio alkaliphilus]|uniref:Uncharacterized protein n=1 Tax=Chitinivibrio alkaliphilus ACht1 TaxID=1313304 RepID=U7D6F9_9BACT|nr:hypothetical protein [Chitinivibrio alkaliphilus]ERP32104.1 hypothetical protein CALK_0825 [Chitinivibrio alkaliphilus ACht1]